jgi:hypothetical protein
VAHLQFSPPSAQVISVSRYPLHTAQPIPACFFGSIAGGPETPGPSSSRANETELRCCLRWITLIRRGCSTKPPRNPRRISRTCRAVWPSSSSPLGINPWPRHPLGHWRVASPNRGLEKGNESLAGAPARGSPAPTPLPNAGVLLGSGPSPPPPWRSARDENGTGTRNGYRIRVPKRDVISDTDTGIFVCRDGYGYYPDIEPQIRVGYGITNTRAVPENPGSDTGTRNSGTRFFFFCII